MAGESNELLSMAKEIQRRVQHLTGEGGVRASERGVSGDDGTLPCDLVETGDGLLLTVDLPGVREGDIHVGIQGRRLQITASRAAAAPKGRHAVRVEQSGGFLKRVVELPCAVDAGAVQTEYQNGVFSVRLKKGEPGSGG